MKRMILTGNEAVALAAVNSGVAGSFAFPGAPAVEIHQAFRRMMTASGSDSPSCDDEPWSTNEKTAYESALGLSYAGRRALVSFHHVGLNVAMDPFMASGVTGVNGGLVVAVADDPSMHYGHSVQDSRILCAFAQLPCIEPWDQKAAYDWTNLAYALSERLTIPVMVRLALRLAHSRAELDLAPGSHDRAGSPVGRPVSKNWRAWSLQPGHARENFNALLDKQPKILEAVANGPFFEFSEEGDRSLGVIACGIGRNYVLEAFERYHIRHPLLSIGAYPVPDELIHRMFNRCERILVVEDGMPVMERRLHAAVIAEREAILGRLTGDLPTAGELTPQSVARAIGVEIDASSLHRTARVHRAIATRSPTPSEPYAFLEAAVAIEEFFTELTGSGGRVFGDVGLFSQAEAPPYDSRETCVDAGASIPMATGASLAGVRPSIAIIGDVTFLHSGMTGLKDAVARDADITVIISDNRPGEVESGSSIIPTTKQLAQIVRGLGVRKNQIHTFNIHDPSFDRGQLVDMLRRETQNRGPSIIICESDQSASPGETASDLRSETKPGAIIESLDFSQVRVATGEINPSTMTRESIDVVIAGVAGQGVMPLAESVAVAAVHAGRRVKQAEMRGLAQEGESLVSHVRLSTRPIHSDLIQPGGAHLLIATEPLEATRWIDFLRPGGMLVANVRPVVNIRAYPYLEEVLQSIRGIQNHVLLDATHLAQAAGAIEFANLVALGAASDVFEFSDPCWKACAHAFATCLPKERAIDAAELAMKFGRLAGRFYRALVEAGVELHDAMLLASHIEPNEDAPAYAHAWKERLEETTGREILLDLEESNALLPIEPEQAV